MAGGSLMITLLLTAAFFVLFDLSGTVFKRLAKPFKQVEERKRRIERITGKEPTGLRKRIVQADQMLAGAGMEKDRYKYKLMSAVLGLIGLAAGLAMNNVFAAFVLMPVLALIPLEIITLRTVQYIRRTGANAQTAMTIVTNAYMMSEDLISAVREALPNLQQPMHGIFKAFLRDVELIDPNVTEAIRTMRSKVENRYWKAWCDTLIECQNDRALRAVLGTILKRMAMAQRMQMELDTLVKNNYIYFFMELALVMIMPVLIGAVLPDFSPLLFETTGGKFTLAIAILLMFFAALQTVKVNKPLDV